MLDASEACVVPVVPSGSFAAHSAPPNREYEPEMLSVTSAERKFRGGLGELVGDATRRVMRTARPGGFIFGLIFDVRSLRVGGGRNVR